MHTRSRCDPSAETCIGWKIMPTPHFWKQTMVRTSKRAASVESFKVMDVLRRANELQAQGHHVLHCEVGQPESGAPRAVALAAAVTTTNNNNVLGYTDAFGLVELRQKLVEHYDQYYHVTLPIRNMVVTTGSSGAFLLAFTACFDVGDVVAVAASGYPCYRNICQALGIHLVHIRLNDEFKLTAQELQLEIQRRAELGLSPIQGLILSSPSNPTGAMLTEDELKDLCAVTDQNDIQFISDEIYHGITYGRKANTALQYSNQAIVINSFSKYYSMSGWRLGWMIVPDDLVHAINSLQQNMFINAPTISQTAALKCWDDDALLELESHVKKYATNRTYIRQQLEETLLRQGCTMAPSDGGFYIYVDLGPNVAPGHDSVAMCTAFLEECHVAFTPGIDFEDPDTPLGSVRFRISYSQGTEIIQNAMRRFRTFWPTWVDRVTTAQQCGINNS